VAQAVAGVVENITNSGGGDSDENESEAAESPNE
jgi:hypothetical protein